MLVPKSLQRDADEAIAVFFVRGQETIPRFFITAGFACCALVGCRDTASDQAEHKSDVESVSAFDIAEEDLELVWQECGLPAPVETGPVRIAMIYEGGSSQLLLRAGFATDVVAQLTEQHIAFSELTVSSITTYQLNIPDLYQLAWWKAVPAREGDRVFKRNNVPSGGYQLSLIRRTESGSELYSVIANRTSQFSPAVVQLFRTKAQEVAPREDVLPVRAQVFEAGRGVWNGDRAKQPGKEDAKTQKRGHH